MLTTLWSPKGGVGVSTVTAMFALAYAGRAEPSMLIDAAGDLPALLGVPEPDGPGIREWTSTPGRSATALDRIATTVSPDLRLVHAGNAPWPEDARHLVAALNERPEHVFVDVGRARSAFLQALIEASPRRLLVVRNCYLSLRSARAPSPSPTGVVVVREPGRALGIGDAEAVTECRVIADIAVDIAIARCLDAGLTASRLPRTLLRSLSRVELDA